MAQSTTVQPIIIIRKKKGHHAAHHGGAWKVAYADFVTAMMALFMVMWLMASSEQVKKSIASYFLDPKGTKHEIGGAGGNGSGKSIYLSIDEMKDLKQKLEQSLRSLPSIEKLKDQITMTITGEGLRIELLENSKGVFFETGNAQPTSLGDQAISLLAAELGKLPNSVVLEGHTDAATYSSSKTYTNWELSADRANEARRVMQSHGVREDQIKQIRGYGDQNLRNSKNPLDPSNRRISVIVLYDGQALAKTGSVGPVKGASAGGKVAQEVVALGPVPTGARGAPAAITGQAKKK